MLQIIKVTSVLTLILFVCSLAAPAQQAGRDPVYILIWFDTEDYILPPSDDLSKFFLLLRPTAVNASLEKCKGQVSTTISHRSGTDSCPARKLPVLRGHFHLFPLFDEEGNPDFQARL